MRKYNFKTNDGKHWRRVNKATARRVFSRGGIVLICPVNLRPDSVWSPCAPIAYGNTSELDINREFDIRVNSFDFHTCINNETGRYVAFYAEEK